MELDRLFSFLMHTQSVGHPERGITPSQGHYLHTEQHKHRINAHIDINVSSGIRTHDPSFRAGEDDSCLRPHGHCDRPSVYHSQNLFLKADFNTVFQYPFPVSKFSLTHLLMELSPSWEAVNCAATQEPPSILWSVKPYVIIKSY
jgi:hypothetical protein